MIDFLKLSRVNRVDVLAQASTVEHNLLLGCPELVDAIRQDKSYDDCLAIINASF